MITPLIITGHTSCSDKETITDSHNKQIDVIKNVNICKKNNPNIDFYTIYSVDETIQSDKYNNFFDVVLYSENIRHPYVGEKIKVETALNHIENLDYEYFIKICSRTILNNIEKYLMMTNIYDYIGKHHETTIQFDTSMFIGNRKLVNVWIDCPPHKDIAPTIQIEKDWLNIYNRLLLENLFWTCCKKHKVNSLIANDLYTNYN